LETARKGGEIKIKGAVLPFKALLRN